MMVALLCGGTLVAQQKENNWFERMREIAEQGKEAALALYAKGSREWRCATRRHMTPRQRFDALTELETYSVTAAKDACYELSNVHRPEEIKELTHAYLHHYALPATAVLLFLAHPYKAPLRTVLLAGAAYGAKKTYAFYEQHRK